MDKDYNEGYIDPLIEQYVRDYGAEYDPWNIPPSSDNEARYLVSMADYLGKYSYDQLTEMFERIEEKIRQEREEKQGKSR